MKQAAVEAGGGSWSAADQQGDGPGGALSLDLGEDDVCRRAGLSVGPWLVLHAEEERPSPIPVVRQNTIREQDGA
jgi:hypothetical protein